MGIEANDNRCRICIQLSNGFRLTGVRHINSIYVISGQRFGGNTLTTTVSCHSICCTNFGVD